MTSDASEGILACYQDGEKLFVRETSLNQAAMQQAVTALCEQFEVKQVTVKYPHGDTPYAMAKSLIEKTPCACYMNLMLD